MQWCRPVEDAGLSADWALGAWGVLRNGGTPDWICKTLMADRSIDPVAIQQYARTHFSGRSNMQLERLMYAR